MSHTTIKAVLQSGRVVDLDKLNKAIGATPVIWNDLAVRHLGAEPWAYSSHLEGIEALFERKDIPAHQRAVLAMTGESALVFRGDFARAAADIRLYLNDFPAEAGRIHHWARIAEIFEGAPNVEAIGFHMSSVNEDPFRGTWNGEREECDVPDLSAFWSVYGELRKQAVHEST
jgi:hypothetical protein